jgi:hypothetical protein
LIPPPISRGRIASPNNPINALTAIGSQCIAARLPSLAKIAKRGKMLLKIIATKLMPRIRMAIEDWTKKRK